MNQLTPKSNGFCPFETTAMIHSLNRKAAAVILDKVGDNQYRAAYQGLLCSAIYNPFTDCFYVDDKFGVIRSLEETESATERMDSNE